MEVVEIPVASGTVSNPIEVRRVLCQSVVLSEPCGVVFSIDTFIVNVVPPLEKTKFEKIAVALSVEGGRFTVLWLHPPEPHDQNTSNGESPADTTMADAGPPTAKPATSEKPLRNDTQWDGV